MSIHEGHRERMRKQLKTSGMDSLSDVQVLEVLLYYAAPRGVRTRRHTRFKPIRDARRRVFRAGVGTQKGQRCRRRRSAADPARAAGGRAAAS